MSTPNSTEWNLDGSLDWGANGEYAPSITEEMDWNAPPPSEPHPDSVRFSGVLEEEHEETDNTMFRNSSAFENITVLSSAPGSVSGYSNSRSPSVRNSTPTSEYSTSRGASVRRSTPTSEYSPSRGASVRRSTPTSEYSPSRGASVRNSAATAGGQVNWDIPASVAEDDDLFDDSASTSSPVPMPRQVLGKTRSPEPSVGSTASFAASPYSASVDNELNEYAPPVMVESEDEEDAMSEMSSRKSERKSMFSNPFSRTPGLKPTTQKGPQHFVPLQSYGAMNKRPLSSGGHKRPFSVARARFNRKNITSIRSPALPLSSLRAKFEPKLDSIESDNPRFAGGLETKAAAVPYSTPQVEERSEVAKKANYPPRKNHWSVRGASLWKKTS